MQNKKINKKAILFISTFLILSSFSIFANYNESMSLESKQPQKTENDLKQADIVWTYNLTGHWGITIDGNTGYSNWSDWLGEDWLSGAGTEGNPYEIKGIFFDGQGENKNLIRIRNSNAYFRIRDCILYNTYYSYYDDSVSNAILLENVQNGKISNVNTSNCNNGIRLVNCQNNRIEGIFANYNYFSGIVIYGGSNNKVNNNTITDSRGICLQQNSFNNDVMDNVITRGRGSLQGIYLSKCHYNNITGNKISNFHYRIVIYEWEGEYYESYEEFGFYGILLSQSTYNNISENFVFNNHIGIILQGASDYNIILRNTVFNNTFSWETEMGLGISISSCSWNTLAENNISYNFGDGLYIVNSDNHSISANILMYNGIDDIYLMETPSIDLSLNEMYGAGLYFDISLSYLDDINIETSNTVNGKPIYFYFNQTGLDQFDLYNAGQIFLYYCNDITILGSDFSDVTAAITLKYCNGITITSIEASDNSRWALNLYECDNNYVSNVEVEKSSIIIKSCNYNEIIENSASYSIENGFLIENCNQSIISKNTATFNHKNGIEVFGNNHGLIYNNTANYNGEEGIKLYNTGEDWFWNGTEWIHLVYTCINNSLISNKVVGNNASGIRLERVDETLISYNSASSNVLGIYIVSFENCTILENNIHHNEHGISINNGFNVTVCNNTVTSNIEYWEYSTSFIEGGTGIGTENVQKALIFGNLINKNAFGIEIGSSYNCKIENNQILENTDKTESIFNLGNPPVDTGITVKSSSAITIQYNYLKENGISLEDSDYNNIHFNEITWTGILFSNSHNNTIVGNRITRGIIGIDLHSSSHNNITNNTIISQQCFRETGECIGNVFENNSCKEEIPSIYLREIMSLIGLASVAGVSITMFIKVRKQR